MAEQYKEMDAVSNVRKRNVLAEHLKEVINMLEKKVWWLKKDSPIVIELYPQGDQIAQLYDLLSFEDKPYTGISYQDHGPTTTLKGSIGRRTGLQMQK